MLEAAGLVVQMNGASEAKSLSGRPQTDPLTDTWASSPSCSGMWLARDKGGSAPEHLAEDDEGT